MDVAAGHVKDEVAEQCQKRFQDFLEEWKDEGEEPKYLGLARELVKPEHNTLQVSVKDIERHSGNLSQTIISEYYRMYPHLCAALKNFVKDHVDNEVDKDLYLSLTEVDNAHKVSYFLNSNSCLPNF